MSPLELVTSAANVTAAAWITASASHQMLINLLTRLNRGAVAVHNVEPGDFGRIAALATRYGTLRPDFAVYRLRNGRSLRNVLTGRAVRP